MTLDSAIKHFGSISALADFLAVTRQAIYQWDGFIPMERQYEIEVRTNGQLKADRSAVDPAEAA